MRGEFQCVPPGCAAGRDSPRRAPHFSLLRQRKVGKRKATPLAVSPALRSGAACDARTWGGAAELASFTAFTSLRQPQRVRSRSRACCAARPAPRPALLGTARGDLKAHAGRRCARTDSPVPSGCAEEHSGRGERTQRSMRSPRELTRRGCLNGAPQARSEFRGAPRLRAPQVARSSAAGRSQWGRFLCSHNFASRSERTPLHELCYFLLAAQKKVGAPPGAYPGQQHIQIRTTLLRAGKGEGATPREPRP